MADQPANLVIEIADYCRKTSPLPNKRIAIAVGLASVAGLAARRYHISREGLNLYILIVGKTGYGKSSSISAMNRLFSEAGDEVSAAHVGPAFLMSGHALAHLMTKKPVFISQFGEFGYRLRDLSNTRRQTTAESLLLSLLLDNYHKSGPGAVMEEVVYRDEKKTLPRVESPAMSFLADTTDEILSEAMNKQTINSGLFPRFSIFRLPSDEFPVDVWNDSFDQDGAFDEERHKALLERIKALAAAVRANPNERIRIRLAPEAKIKLDECRIQYQKVQADVDSDSVSALANRCHAKVLRYAGLLAVGNLSCEEIAEGIRPFVTTEIAQHAIDLEYDLWTHNKAAADDNPEAPEHERIRLILSFFESWLDGNERRGLRVKYRKYIDYLVSNSIVPWEAVYQRFRKMKAFDCNVSGRKQASKVIEGTLEALEGLGSIVTLTGDEVKEVQADTEIEWRQALYRIISTEYVRGETSVPSIYETL